MLVALPCTISFPVVVALPRTVSPPAAVPLPIVEEAFVRSPLVNVSTDVVAFPGNGSIPPLSVPQVRTPSALAFTSQFTAFKFDTISCEVEAVPETERLVVVAFVVVVFPKMFPPVHILEEYIFGIVVDASIKLAAK